MSGAASLPGITSETIDTPRLRTHLLAGGDEGGTPVLFVHGNVSSSRFWEETIAALPTGYRGLAPDLRGFGDSQDRPVDATRGTRDFADDLRALVETMGLTSGGGKIHLVGWSTGGGIIMQMAIDHPNDVASLTLVNPVSPYGYGGTKGTDGTPCWPDYAGSGGGTANPEFVRRLAEGDRGTESDTSPRNVMNAFYWKPPFRPDPEREELYVSSMLSTVTGSTNYPGDMISSGHWPHVAPGTEGILNALAPRFCNLSDFAQIDPRPPVLWVRGTDDQIVADAALFDLAVLGQLGAVPGWPGPEAHPPQPMIAQTRAVLDAYAAAGGRYREEAIPDCGHTPHVERADRFREILFGFLHEQSGG